MSGFLVQRVSKVYASPVVALVYEGINALVQENHETWPLSQFPVDLSGPCVLALDKQDGDVVGVIAYTVLDRDRVEVTLAYVEHSSRRQGIFRAMHATLCETLREEGYACLSFQAHHDNAAGQHALAAIRAKVAHKTFLQGL